MALVKQCDSCKKEISEDNPLVFQMWMAPIANGRPGKRTHSEYTMRMDIGKCCLVKMSNVGKWQKRKKQGRRSANP